LSSPSFNKGAFKTQIVPACDPIKCCPFVIVDQTHIKAKDTIAGDDVKTTSASKTGLMAALDEYHSIALGVAEYDGRPFHQS